MSRDRTAERRAVELMRAAVLAWYGDRCACCGTTEDLGVDHIEGDGRAQRVALFGRNPVSGPFYRWLIEQRFPDGIQTLCRVCNSSKQNGDACRLDHADREGQRRRRNARAQAAWRVKSKTGRYVSTKPGTAGGRILAYLGDHPNALTAEIAADLGLSYSTAAATLSGLARSDLVVRPRQGMYRLPAVLQPVEARRVYQPPPDGWGEVAGRAWAAGTTWTVEITDKLCILTKTILIGQSRGEAHGSKLRSRQVPGHSGGQRIRGHLRCGAGCGAGGGCGVFPGRRGPRHRDVPRGRAGWPRIGWVRRVYR